MALRNEGGDGASAPGFERAPWRSLLPAAVISIAALLIIGSIGEGCNSAQPVGTTTCLACHDGRTGADKREITESVHDDVDCEVCHGPGSAHVRNVGRGSFFIGNPARLPIPDSTAVCSECHEGHTEGFLATAHAAADVSCHACHDVHLKGGMLFSTSNRSPLSQDQYTQACVDCHVPEVDDYQKSRHFELPELTCGICHNMHVNDMFTLSPVDNQLCLVCHQSRDLGFGSVEVVDEHTGGFHPVDPAGTGSSRCTSCHLPPLDAADPVRASKSHVLDAVPPIATNEAIFAGAEIVPANSCAGVVGCHDPGGTGSGSPHDPFATDMNEALQELFESIGFVPDTE